MKIGDFIGTVIDFKSRSSASDSVKRTKVHSEDVYLFQNKSPRTRFANFLSGRRLKESNSILKRRKLVVMPF